MTLDGNSKDVLLKTTTKNEQKLPKKAQPMSQKSRHWKWINNVGDLNACIENPNVLYKKNVKIIMTPDLRGLAVEVGAVKVHLA